MLAIDLSTAFPQEDSDDFVDGLVHPLGTLQHDEVMDRDINENRSN
jgi:hypothetical protein